MFLFLFVLTLDPLTLNIYNTLQHSINFSIFNVICYIKLIKTEISCPSVQTSKYKIPTINLKRTILLRYNVQMPDEPPFVTIFLKIFKNVLPDSFKSMISLNNYGNRFSLYTL